MNKDQAIAALEAAGHFDLNGSISVLHVTYNIANKELCVMSVIDREAWLVAQKCDLKTAHQLEYTRYKVVDGEELSYTDGNNTVTNITAALASALTSPTTNYVVIN